MEDNISAITIEMVWSTDKRIFISASDGKEYSQPLEMFPALMYATQEQRDKFTINKWHDAIHWREIDEDIHISSFFERETVDYNNEVNRLLSRFPWLDLKVFASYIGMHWTKLARLRFGVWKASDETLKKIKDGIVAIGKEMSAAVL